ncbi:SRPBCC domain-containing protein [Qaidamihabitans albus]|uniref:SRPBCC domain-containing protein n=1 Tax=Qaidamihabitans albus TaxID=2795733 RepID=UPI0018F271BB|nr:SRPBCC domain-containing protein [Qaidamihabitans albus]
MDIDRIEREIMIDAPAERVWSKLVEFAWVNDTAPGAFEPREGEVLVAEHSRYGKFPMLVEKVEPSRYLAYRWASAFPGQETVEGNSTRVEFTLTEEAGRTRLHLLESGFAALPEASRRPAFDDNTHGWTDQLDALRRRVERPAG